MNNDPLGLEAGAPGYQDPSLPQEIAPGVLEQRRFFLKAPIAAVAALILGKAGLALEGNPVTMPSKSPGRNPEANAPDESGQLDFEIFFQDCAALAKHAFADPNLNEDAHLYRIAALAARLNPKTIPDIKIGRFADLNPPVRFGPVRVAAPLAVILWRLDPGAVLPPHNHNPADVLSLCLAGEARVRHFDILGEAPEYTSKKSFLIRETRNILLTPGRMSGLTETRDNIHTFQAGEQGAVGIDINTLLPKTKDFSFLEFTDQPVDGNKRTYEAFWTGLA